jgi:UDP-N-acetylmuramate dehydrogenase
VRLAVENIRSQKFPDWTMVGTAGSFFKNPIITASHYDELKQVYKDIPGYVQADEMVKVSLGYILDKICGLKGYCEDKVCLYEKQALVLVASESATATEIEKFSNSIKERVFTKTKIKIDCEVSFL